MKDRQAIRPETQISNLIYRYAEMVDRAEFDDLAVLFARATVVMGGREFDGAGLADRFRTTVRLYDGIPRTAHLMSNVIIELAPDGSTATASTRYTVLQAPPGGQLVPIITGGYRDEFATDSEGWYFKRREYGGGLAGDLSRHLVLEA